jgi:hypothetical protein
MICNRGFRGIHGNRGKSGADSRIAPTRNLAISGPVDRPYGVFTIGVVQELESERGFSSRKAAHNQLWPDHSNCENAIVFPSPLRPRMFLRPVPGAMGSLESGYVRRFSWLCDGVARRGARL